jgi:hypothetical protein
MSTHAVHQSGNQIEFVTHVPPVGRILLFLIGLLPLLAPYELLIRPQWPDGFYVSPIFWFSLVISAGAMALTFFAVFAALYGLNQRVRFDAGGELITHDFDAALVPHRKRRYPFSAVETLSVKRHEWMESPTTYSLALKVEGVPEFEFGKLYHGGRG